MEEIKEEWKPVVGFESLYAVSNLGRVKSLNYRNQGFEKIMRLSTSPDGYYYLTLYKNNKGYTKRPNRLVAEAFIPNPNGYEEVNHIDTNRKNNIVTNLEWCTHAYNIEHSKKLGNYNRPDWVGEGNPNYGNRKLSQIYANNKDLAKEKQSRPAEQNGRATPVKLYKDGEFVKEFSYIALCLQYLKDIGVANQNSSIETIRGRVNDSIRRNGHYKGYTLLKYIK